jgi:hypothetical protein
MSMLPDIHLGSDIQSEMDDLKSELEPENLLELNKILEFFALSDQVFLEKWNQRSDPSEIHTRVEKSK